MMAKYHYDFERDGQKWATWNISEAKREVPDRRRLIKNCFYLVGNEFVPVRRIQVQADMGHGYIYHHIYLEGDGLVSMKMSSTRLYRKWDNLWVAEPYLTAVRAARRFEMLEAKNRPAMFVSGLFGTEVKSWVLYDDGLKYYSGV